MSTNTETSGPASRSRRAAAPFTAAILACGPGCCTASPVPPSSSSCSCTCSTPHWCGSAPRPTTQVVDTYKTPLVGLMEVGLVAAVLYHALNGIRVILIDFWQHGPRYQRLMLWVVAAHLAGRDDPRAGRARHAHGGAVPVSARVDAPPPRGTHRTRAGEGARPPGDPGPSARTASPEGHPVLREVRLAVHAVLRRRAGLPGARPPVHHADVGRRGVPHRLQLRRAAVGLAVLADLGYGRCCGWP